MKTVKFHTLGCKVNQYDTQNIREQFLRAGFIESGGGRAADICVINTCTVTHKADTESLAAIRRAKRENRRAKVIVTGCLAELDAVAIKKQGADLIVKNRDKGILLTKLQSLRARRAKQSQKNRNCAACCEPVKSKIASSQKPFLAMTGISDFEGRTRAFLKVQDGCDNFCSYCKVPLVRGRSRSRPMDEVIEEAGRLVHNGFKEIVLTGICLGSYNWSSHCEEAEGRRSNLKNKAGLVDVISSLEKINGLLRIRLSSIEAGDVTDALIDKMAASAKLCPHLHIPIQSGDDQVLAKMNRKYTREDYIRLIKKIRRRIPDIAITTDVLAGFPGESGQNFNNSVRLIKEIQPLKVHIFPYSRRAGTAADRFEAKVRPEELKKRIFLLRKAADQCALGYKKRFLNKTLPVLIEGPCKNRAGFWQGHTANYIKVIVSSKYELANDLILLKIKKIFTEYALGHFC